MKQGQASHSGMGSTKVEPKSQAVNPGGVDQMGQATAFRKTEIYEGRGLKAPMATSTTHKGGSQGRY